MNSKLYKDKITEELYFRADKLTDYIKRRMDEGYMSMDEIYNLDNQHTGYLKAIEHYKQLMVGGKHED
tara:strand:- start:1799 stop:2002 length:204 start_codon:yes stop_codon:yes gene_type:complete